MKKLLLPMLFLLLVLPAMSQGYVSINGIVTNVAGGTPVPNQAVTILSDSSFGWIYNQTVYTNPNGYFMDTVPVPSGSSGSIYVQTIDCQNYLHQVVLNYTPANLNFTVTFTICAPQGSSLPTVITGQATDVSSFGVVLHGFVDPNGAETQVTFEYGTTTAYGTLLPCGNFTGNTFLAVSDSLLDLTPGTLYHYRINGTNSFGTAHGADSTFTTLVLDAPPTAITEFATNISNNGAVIHGLYNANGYQAVKVLEWGLTNSYGNDTSAQTGGYYNSTMQASLTGLLPNTTYHFRAYITYGGGNVYGNDHTFTTPGSAGCQAAFMAIPDSMNNPPMTYHFIDQSSGNNISSWLWNFGDPASGASNTSTSQNPYHAYSQAGTYTTCLTIQGADSSCFDMTCETLVVSYSPCVANFTYQQFAARSFQFVDMSQANGSPVSWSWNFGDGGFSADQNPIHVYSTNGWYSVTLSIGNPATGCSDQLTRTVFASDSTGGGCHAAFLVVPDSINTPPHTYYFFNQSTGNNLSTFIWNFGDGQSQTITFPGSPNVTHTYAQPGIYMACLTIEGADSSCFDMTCDTLFIGSPPGCQAAFTYYADSSNSNTTLHFIDQSSGNIVGWEWNFGDPASGANNISTAQNPVHVFSASGSYNVCLTIHGADSLCYDVACSTVVVEGGSGCQAYFTYATDPAPGNHTINFTDHSTGLPTSWFWNFGDGTSSTVQNPVHTFADTAVSHTVCLTITGNNCTSTFCKQVVIEDSSTYHQIYGQVFAGNFPISMGLAMIFSLDTSANYQPFVEVFPIDSNGVYYFTMVPDGNYYVLVIPFDSNGYLPTYYGNTINWEQATLIPLGTAHNPYDIHLVSSGLMTYGPGSASGQINTRGLKTSMMDKVNMILMNDQGLPIGFTSVSSSGVFSFPSMAYGTYYLHPEMPGVSSDRIMITLTPEKPHADVVMTFSGNKILGMRDEVTLVNHWSVYPNPVTENFTISIDMKQGTQAEIEIYNMAGQRVVNAAVTLHDGANKLEFSTSALPVGIYSLRFLSNDGMNISTRLIKTR
jgi:PKD repeat protein